MARYLVIFFVLAACGSNNSDLIKADSPLSMVVYSDSILTYYGQLQAETMPEKKATEEKSIKQILEASKKVVGDELNVRIIISGYGSTVSEAAKIINWVAEAGIKNYAISDADSNEMRILNIQPFDWQPAKPIEIEQPSSLKDFDFPSRPAFYIRLNDGSHFSYKIDSAYNEKNFKRLAIKDSLILANKLSEFKSGQSGNDQNLLIYIISNNNSSYSIFETVINALHKNDIYTYKLLTY